MQGYWQIHSAQTARDSPYHCLTGRRRQPEERPPLANDLATAIGRAAQNGLRGKVSKKSRQVSKPASCFLADDLVSCVARWLIGLELEPALEEKLASLVVSCEFALASKSLLSSDISWGYRLVKHGRCQRRAVDQSIPLGMHTSHPAS